MKQQKSNLAPSENAEPTTGRRVRKRQQIMDHLANTAWPMFQERGFDVVSMEAIADAADVAKATLYKHFPVKGALLSHYLHLELAGHIPMALAAMEKLPDTATRLRAYLNQSAKWINQHGALFAPYLRYRLSTLETMLTDSEGGSHHSGNSDLFLVLLRTGQQVGDIRLDIDAEVLQHYFVSLYLVAVTHWLAKPDVNIHKEFDNIVDFFMRAAAPTRAAPRRTT